jgi:hypothetical protein
MMRNEQIDGLIVNHNLVPLLKQKWMQTLEVKKMKSSSKIDLKDVSWWMSIKDAYKLGVLVIVKLFFKMCIFLIGWKHIKVKQNWHIVIVHFYSITK